MDRLDNAIDVFKLGSRLSLQRYGEPIVVTYSGGKDSEALLYVAQASGEPFEVHNSHTTVDSPDTVYHIRKKFRELELQGIKVTIERPTYKGKPTNMYDLIVAKKSVPTRLMRFCCAVLKETGCANRMISTGVRWEESNKRKSRNSFETITHNRQKSVKITYETMLMNDNAESRELIEYCKLKGKTVCNPIIDWTTKDVWELINSEKIDYNPMYDNGYCRVGCIGCPMATNRIRKKEFADYPQYKANYIRAFNRMIEARNAAGLNTEWKTGEECFLWWVEDNNMDGQYAFDLATGSYDRFNPVDDY